MIEWKNILKKEIIIIAIVGEEYRKESTNQCIKLKPKKTLIQKIKPKNKNSFFNFRWTSMYSTFSHNSLSKFDNVQVCVIPSCDTGNKSFQVVLGNK